MVVTAAAEVAVVAAAVTAVVNHAGRADGPDYRRRLEISRFEPAIRIRAAVVAEAITAAFYALGHEFAPISRAIMIAVTATNDTMT